jgi:ABC-2 type transport system ATP-binding protein
MILATALTKRYGETVAVDDLSFRVEPGRVTGFLGPNGAGKSTTMRLVLGLDAPTSGSVTVNGDPFRRSAAPLRTIGALLDPNAVDPRRSAANHLRWLADSNRIARRRVDEVLGLVGLSDVAGRRVGSFSLGMNQRLGIATALLGDPDTLLLDEPINGLDPEGIVWVRTLLRDLAREGRTVFVSSHLMSEMANTADHLLVVGRGHLVADAPTAEVIGAHARHRVLVAPADPTASPRLANLFGHHGGDVELTADDGLVVTGLEPRTIGEIATTNRTALALLSPEPASLEDAFLDLTRNETDYRADLGATQRRA